VPAAFALRLASTQTDINNTSILEARPGVVAGPCLFVTAAHYANRCTVCRGASSNIMNSNESLAEELPPMVLESYKQIVASLRDMEGDTGNPDDQVANTRATPVNASARDVSVTILPRRRATARVVGLGPQRE
jgi:hypothetical protein